MTIITPNVLVIFRSFNNIAATSPEVTKTTHMSLPANSSDTRIPPAYADEIPRIPRIFMTPE